MWGDLTHIITHLDVILNREIRKESVNSHPEVPGKNKIPNSPISGTYLQYNWLTKKSPRCFTTRGTAKPAKQNSGYLL